MPSAHRKQSASRSTRLITQRPWEQLSRTLFVRSMDRAIIDEVQRAPELLLAIKESVDTDQRPGRFLLTGSANLTTLPRVADSLAGRMEVVRLLPLAQCEIRSAEGNFLLDAFRNEVKTGDSVIGDDLVTTVLAEGYPEALGRKTWSRRAVWLAPVRRQMNRLTRFPNRNI
jgi:uncharacterized protein